MKSKLIVGIAVLVLLGGGGVAYVLSQDKADTDTTNNSSESATESSDDTPTFAPNLSDDTSFIATMEVNSTNESENFNGKIERAKNGDIKFSGVQAGQNVEMYLTTEGVNIVCQDAQCFQLSSGTSSLEELDITPNADDLEAYKSTAVYKGKEACSSGTCNVWEYTDDENVKVTAYIDKDSNRIVEINGIETDGSTLKLTYEYTDVTVIIPENVETLPGGI